MGGAPADASVAALQRLLAGREILAYTTSDDGKRRFTRALRAKPELHAREPMPDAARAG